MPQVSAKLFAHIHNDPQLSHSPLEGINFDETAGYLSEFLDRLNQKQIHSIFETPINTARLSEFTRQTKRLSEVTKPLGQLQQNNSPAFKVAFEKLVQDIMSDLQQGKNVFLPGGWVGMPGHAMLYELKPAINGKTIFLCWNAGAGANHHDRIESKKGFKFSPVKAYLLSNSQSQDTLKAFLLKLLEPNVLSDETLKKKFNGKKIYREVLSQVALLDGIEVSPRPYASRFTLGQFSGTCAWAVLMEMLNNRCEAVEDFLQIHIDLLFDSISNFIADAHAPLSAQDIFMLKHAKQNLARHMLMFDKKYEIETSAKEKIIELIKKADRLLKNSKVAEAEDNQPYHEIDDSKKQFRVTSIPSFPEPVLDINNQIENYQKNDFKQAFDHNISMSSFEDNLNTVLAEASNETPTNRFHIQQRLESFFLNLPLNATLTSFSNRKLDVFSEKLMEAFEKYINITATMDEFPHGERVVACLSALAFFESLVAQRFKGNKKVTDAVIASANQFKDKLFEDIFENPSFNINNAKLARRLRDIDDIFLSHPTQAENSDNYLTEITYQNRALREEASRVLIPNSSKKTRPGLYFLSHRNNPNFRELGNDLLFGMRFEQMSIHCRKILASGFSYQQSAITLNKLYSDLDYTQHPEQIKYIKYKCWRDENSQYDKQANQARSWIQFKHDYLKDSFGRDVISANEIQINNYKINEQENLKKAILSIRRNRESQVIATIELIQSEIDRLSDPTLQEMLFALIFQADYLLLEVNENPESLNRMLDIIENGIRINHISGSRKQPIEFYLQLGAYLTHYLATLPSKNEVHLAQLLRLKKIHHNLSQQTDALLKQNALNVDQIKALQFNIKVETVFLNAQLAEKGSLDSTQMKRFFKLQFAKNKFAAAASNKYLDHQIKLAQAQLQSYLKENTLTTADFLNIIGDVYDLDIQSERFTTQFPKFTNDNYSFNPLTGEFVDKKTNRNALPLNILENELFKNLFTTPVQSIKGIGHNLFEFGYEGNQYRVSYELNSNQLNIYRRFHVSGAYKWAKLANDQGKVFKQNKIPHSLMSDKKQLWIELDRERDDSQSSNFYNYRFDTNNSQGFYITSKLSHELNTYYHRESSSIKSLRHSDHWSLIDACEQTRADGVFNVLQQFEDPRFIEVWQNDRIPGDIEFRLPRYHLAFVETLDEEGNTILVDKSNPNWVLKSNQNKLIGSFAHYLKLEDKDGKQPPKYIIPRKMFYAKNQESEGARYKLTYDTGSIVNATMLGMANQHHGVIDDFIDPTKFNFDNSEQYITATRDTKGNLNAQSILGKIHLAYIYLAKDKPGKALRLLKQVKSNFNGDAEQACALLSLINDLPVQNIFPPLAQKAKVNSPEHIAIRTFVVNIIASYRSMGGTINLPIFKHEANDNNEKLLETKMATSAKLLENDRFDKEVKATLEQYSKASQYIPKKLQLKTKDLDALVSFGSYNKSDEDSGFGTQPLFLRKLRKTLKLKRWGKILRANRAQGHTTDPLNAKAKAQKSYQLQANSLSHQTSSIVKKLIDFKLSANTLADNKSIFSEKPAFLTIDTLNHQTCLFEIKNNLEALYREACRNPAKENVLRSFLIKGIKANIFSQNGAVAVYGTLLSMINHKKVTEEVFSVRNLTIDYNGKYIQGPGNASLYVSKYDLQSDATKCFYKVFGDVSVKGFRSKPDIDKTLSIKKQIKPLLKQIKPMPKPKLSCGLSDLGSILQKHSLENLSSRVKPKQSTNSTSQLFTAFDENEPFVKQLLDETNKDYVAGCEINARTKSQNEHFIKHLDSARKIDQIAASLNDSIAKQNEQFERLEKQIIADFYRLPTDKDARVNEVLGKQAKHKKVNDIFQFFLKNDLSAYQRNTNLSESEIKQLHNNVYTYLILGTKIQQSKRALGHIENIRQLPSRSGEEYHKYLYQLGHELTAERAYDPTEHLEILLFEFLDNKLIYKKQYEMLKKLIQKNNGIPNSTVIKLIMGGGKSKVLLPLLAKLKAEGNNLVCVEVPRELFETNYQDLSAISKQIFGQSAHPFKFNRNMNTGPEFFFRMKEQLLQIIANKEFIISTRESIQSLELKLIDLLATPSQDLNDWVEEIDYLSQVINIIKHQGDAIMDEVDIDLNPRDQLIYTAGYQYFTDQYILNAQIEFYAFMRRISLKDGDETLNLLDIVKNKQTKPSEKTLDQLIEMIPKALVEDKLSPIADIVKHASTKDKQDLIEFLAGTNAKQSSFVKKQSKADKNILSLYRAQVKDVLKIALKRNYKEHFGLPMDKSKSPSEKLLAIPYSGAQSPKEYAKFKNSLLALNYTTQIHLIEELDRAVFQMFIEYFKDELDTEHAINAQKSKPDYTVRNQFIRLLKISQKEFDDLNLESTKQINALFEKQKTNEVLKHFCLAQYILPKIVSHNVTIGHDAQNHVDMYRSVIGFTGTDYNYRTFHPSIKCDTSDSFGTDGQTIDNLLRIEKEIKHTGTSNFHLLAERRSVLDIIKKHPHINDLRAIIDVGAEFKNEKNIEVAKKLRDLFKAQASSNLKYILYFNEEDILHALPINRENGDAEPIVLNSSDNLDKKLDCTPDEYFTFYDQKRTTGTDIKQANNTLGILTVSEKTTFRDLAQGANRFRDLKGLHRVEYAIMPNLQKAYPQYNTNWDTTKLINVTINQQAQVLMTLHLQGAMQKINGLFRNHLMTKVRTSTSLTDKAIYADAFRKYLLEYANTNLFEKYGTPEQTVDMKVMLDDHVKRTMKRWFDSIQNAQQKPSSAEKDALLKKATSIVSNEVKICRRKIKTPLMGATEAEVTTQKEVEKEQENERELQTKTYKRPNDYKSWSHVKLQSWKPTSRNGFLNNISNGSSYRAGPSITSLENIAKTQPVKRNWAFDKNIYMSENFYECCGLSNKFNQFKKPGFYVLMLKEGSQVSSTLITTDEAAEIRTFDNPSNSKRQMWIETNSCIPYWGKRPSNVDSQIDAQREQINFFNGDTPYLVAQLEKSSWLAKEAASKMQFLKDHVMRYHPNKNNKVNVLYRKLIAQNAIDPKEMKVNAQTKVDSFEDRPILHINPNKIVHKKVSSKDKDKLKSYIDNELGKITPDQIIEETQEEKRKKKRIKAFLIISAILLAATLAVLGYMYRTMIKMFLTQALNWIMMQTASQLALLAFQTVSPIVCFGGLFYIIRNDMKKQANKKYQTVDEIESIQNHQEADALKRGVRAKTWSGYCESFFYLSSYTHLSAYYRGLQIGQDNAQRVKLTPSVQKAEAKLRPTVH